MIEKIGKRALVLPLVMALGLCCILSLAVGPMLRAEPTNVPFAIVNLDEGAITVAGNTNVGQTLADKLISGESSLGDMGSDSDDGSNSSGTNDSSSESSDDGGNSSGTSDSDSEGSNDASNSSDSDAGGSSDSASDSDDSSASSMANAICWVQMESEEELAAALDSNEIYGGIVIPANFTSQQMSSTVGLANAPEIDVYLNVAKSPQVASSLQNTLQNAMLKAGIASNIEMVNDADLGGGSMSSTTAVQMLVMPLFIMTMICSILLTLLFWKKDVTGLKKKNPVLAALALVVIITVFAAVVAMLAQFIDSVAGGMNLTAYELFLFLWFACGCCMLCFVGVCCLSFPLGALLAVGTFALGMSCAMLTPEMLPQLWADWVYPWAPQAHIGNGVRSIIYMGHAPSSADLNPLLAFGIAGIASLLAATGISLFKQHKGTANPKLAETTSV